jgi:hypothetical protein
MCAYVSNLRNKFHIYSSSTSLAHAIKLEDKKKFRANAI